MATVEAETFRDEHVPQGGLVYDGFISYSHAADDLLAPRLQSGLQRFAKPWWRRRALRIFRDEASLTANPHLWASITNALDRSAWFILLLSPDAAESEWVNREVEYWVGNKDPDHIIPVLTEGEFAWDDGGIDSDAVPPALHGTYTDEPRWVDMRFAHTDEQLDLNNATFRSAIADIAAPIHGVPKEELESEEVRQHRRSIRTAWLGGIALLLLTILTTATALYANSQRQDAQLNEQAARTSEEAATDFALLVLLDSAREQSPSAPAGGNSIRANKRNIPLPVAEEPPPTPRLAFLENLCPEERKDRRECSPKAVFRDPTEQTLTSLWPAGDAFHIRHGFVNPSETPLGSAFPPDFEVIVYVTRIDGRPLADGNFELNASYRFTPDHLVRVMSDRCGPGYATQSEPLPCDEFVFEFNDGLPPGLYGLWVEWWAPCSWWTTAAVCNENDTPLRLFTAEVGPHIYGGFLGDVVDQSG
jgi:hypothetical protein